jgi:origin recognition complex subunit 1
LTPRKNGKKPRANKGDEESRFAIGDGVLVDVEGGADGVGVLIRLWEEPDKDEDEEGDEDSNGGNDSARRKRKEENGDATEVRMMAEVHWCFRRKDLPGIMKNLTVEDVSSMPPI